jgi:hypothetical protein
MSWNQRIKSTFWNIKDDDIEVLHRVAIKPFEHHPTDFADTRVTESVKYHNEKWFHNELVVRATNATVEPQYAYAVDRLRTIIGASIRVDNNLPSPVPMLKATFLGKRIKLKKAILFDGNLGANYFHFLSDTLHKIYLLERFTEIDCPLLVGKSVWSKPFFQFIIQETELSKYDWRQIQGAIKVEELLISRPMPYEKKYWQQTKRLFIPADKVINEQKVIFINRAGTRHIVNFKEVKSVLNKHSIDVFEPGNMNMKDQAKLFNSASHIIGIHGAGMTNLVFCNHEKANVLELCSSNCIGTQYYWLCQSLGIKWDMMLGSEANTDFSFELNTEMFDQRLQQFLVS